MNIARIRHQGSSLGLLTAALVAACSSSQNTAGAGTDAASSGSGSGAGGGGTCSPGQMMCSGVCVETSSCAFALLSVEPRQGFQNGGEWVTLRGAGFAAGMRVYIADGRAPVKVLNATTARIQTPPGTLGNKDVKIVLGATSAALPGSFEYLAAGLNIPWQQKPMQHVRGEHPAVAVLQDGRALITGGTTTPDDPNTAQNTAEIFDRPSEAVSPAANTMSTIRWFHSAVTMLDGKVLVVGGACDLYDLNLCPGDQKVADLFDPATNTFSPAPSPQTMDRFWTHAVLLPDGRVLIQSGNDASLEAYDPDKGTFTMVGATAEKHDLPFLVRLRDGRVLVGGGVQTGGGTVDLFDPDTNMVEPVGPMVTPRGWLTAHTLPDGRVLVIGGDVANASYTPLDTIEVFDPATKSFSLAPYKLILTRFAHASALVRDGTVLVLGGYIKPTACSPPADTNTVDAIDPVAGTVTPFAPLMQPRVESTAVTLLDGSVLHIAGGHCGTPVAVPYLDFLPGAMVPK